MHTCLTSGPRCRTTNVGGAVTRARRFRLPGPRDRDDGTQRQ